MTLHIAREEPEGSFRYAVLRDITAPDAPEIAEVGYDPKVERFVSATRRGALHEENVDAIARALINAIARIHFQ